jgi:hypothetical protein
MFARTAAVPPGIERPPPVHPPAQPSWRYTGKDSSGKRSIGECGRACRQQTLRAASKTCGNTEHETMPASACAGSWTHRESAQRHGRDHGRPPRAIPSQAQQKVGSGCGQCDDGQWRRPPSAPPMGQHTAAHCVLPSHLPWRVDGYGTIRLKARSIPRCVGVGHAIPRCPGPSPAMPALWKRPATKLLGCHYLIARGSMSTRGDRSRRQIIDTHSR